MKPKEVLKKAINDFLLEKFENKGFKFYKSQLALKNKLKNGFTEELRFRGNRTNISDIFVSFELSYWISCSAYKKWNTKNFPGEPGGNISGNRAILNKMKKNYISGFGYDFIKFKPNEITKEIWENYKNYGSHYFEENNSWDKIIKSSSNSIEIADSLIFQNKLNKAFNVMNNFKEKYREVYGKNEDTLMKEQIYRIIQKRIRYLKLKMRS